MVLDIQTTVRVIENAIQMDFRRTPCALDIHKKSRVLLFEFQHTLLLSITSDGF